LKLQFFSKEGYILIGDSNKLIELANKFLHCLKLRGLSIQSLRSYGYDLIFIFKWLENDKKDFKEIKQKCLLDFISYQRDLDAKPRSINRRLSTLECFFRFVYDESIPRSPLVNYPAPYYKGPGKDRYLGIFNLKRQAHLRLRVKVPKTLVVGLEVKEVNQFLQDIKRYRDMAIFLIMLFCGLRSNEVLLLKTDNIDLIRLQVKILGKGNKERVLPMSKYLLTVINQYLKFERPNNCETKELFVVLQGIKRGNPMTKAGLRSLFRHRRKKLNIEKAHPHTWRHTFATDMARAGVSLSVLQKMMGHASIESTEIYINITMTDVMEEYEKAMLRLKKRYEYS
jgi:site-specific recombinase XerD